jgi:peptidoglycan/xylan/chitin deacetylase (PgdA/CDA1 family)
VLLRGIFYLAQQTETSLPCSGSGRARCPRSVHLSHDTDGNDESLGHKLLEVLHKGEVNSTWCVLLPGYGPELMKKIKDAGHEYGTHYDAMSPGLPWSAEQFDRQIGELTKMFGGEKPVTNKNHYLRWENDTDIWDWCLKHGIGLDQSKGASKTGEAGFNFGTCHPYFPVRFDGSTIDVLELPTPTQDLFVFAPEAILEPLLTQAKKMHGVLHLLFHPAHFRHQQVVDAILMSIRRGREEGLEWWTGRQINAWERARRTAKIAEFSSESFTIAAEHELPHATVLWLGKTRATRAEAGIAGNRDDRHAQGVGF